jgi:hypothetical protein
MKRNHTWFTMFCMILMFSSTIFGPTTYAQSQVSASQSKDISESKAKEIAENTFHFLKNLQFTSAQMNEVYSETYGDQSNWLLNYVNELDQEVRIRIFAKSGMIKSFVTQASLDSTVDQMNTFVDEEQAKKNAWEWLQKIKFPYMKQVELIRFERSNRLLSQDDIPGYFIRFYQVVNGIPFFHNAAEIQLDHTGQVVVYKLTWNEHIQFESTDHLLSESEGEKRLHESVQIYPYYFTPQLDSGPELPYVRYHFSPHVVDAKSGKPLRMIRVAEDQPFSQFTKQYASDTPLSKTDEAKSKLTYQQIISAVESELNIPKDFVINSINSYNKFNNEYSLEGNYEWQMIWQKETKNSNPQGNTAQIQQEFITVNYDSARNIMTGYLMQLQPMTSSDRLTEWTYEQGFKKAKEFIAQQVPHLAHRYAKQAWKPLLEQMISLSSEKDWIYRFELETHGIASDQDYIELSVDKKSGIVTSYQLVESLLHFPIEKPLLLTKDKAMDVVKSNHKLKVFYMLPDVDINQMIEKPITNAQQMSSNPPPKAILVYGYHEQVNVEGMFLDAMDGVWRDNNTGYILNFPKAKAVDLAGHYAQKQIQMLVDLGVWELDDQQVYPNQAIRMGELMKILMHGIHAGFVFEADWNASQDTASMTAEEKLEPYLEKAQQLGFIPSKKEFDPNQQVTREQLASLLLKSMNMYHLAKYKNMFHQNFKDLSQIEHSGAAAIVTGLGIMSVQDGHFNPKHFVSRADASIALLRMIWKINEIVNSYH